MPLSKRERDTIALSTSSAKRELADFYQRRVSILDRNVLISVNIVTILIALLAAFCAGGGLKPGEVQAVVLIGTISAVGTPALFWLIYAGRAARLRDAYYTEWKSLFGGGVPYPLSSILLRRRRAKKPKRHAFRHDRSAT